MSTPNLETLLQQGIVGFFCFLLIFVVWKLFGLYVEAQKDKIDVLRESLLAAAPLAEAIKELTRSHSILADKIEDMEKAQLRMENDLSTRRR